MPHRFRLPLALFLAITTMAPRAAGSEPAAERPRLVVLMAFDQLRGDYPARWQEQFGEGGFKRLAREGTWFTDCHYPYANTFTACGHASLATGCSPYKHGMVGNSWYERKTKTVVNAVSSDRYRQLPEPAKLPKNAKLGVSADYRLAPSVADALRAAAKGKSKVVSLSIKDRAAALLAALLGELVYWFSDLTGGFVTATHYRDAPHEWVERFNGEGHADAYFGKDWTRFRPALDYDKLAGPDDFIGEAKTLELGRTFPHPLTGGLEKPGQKYYNALMTSPMGNDLLLKFAKRAIEEEKLGQREAPDLLLLGFSPNDLVGHVFGPDSHEVLDITLRTDALIADFLTFLDRKVGKGRYAVVVSSDHGICPLPEVVQSKGREAGRIAPTPLRKDAETSLQETFGESERPYIEAFVSPWFYFDYRTLAERKAPRADAERKLADWLVKAYGPRGIQAAYTNTELVRGMPKDKIGQMVWRSHHPERCGDVTLVTKPYFFVSGYLTGTTHGSPHEYDTHVPLYVYGPGIPAGTSDERVTPQAAAVIIAHLLGIEAPSGADVELPRVLRGR